MPQSTDDALRTRAYLLWEADGRPDGGAEHYWSLAAAEAVAEKPKRAKAASTTAPEKKAKPKAATKSAAKAAAKSSAKPRKTKA